MTAKEARDLSIKSSGDQITRIMSIIKAACENGETSISIAFISKGTMCYLINNGFRVDESDGTSYTSYIISWD